MTTVTVTAPAAWAPYLLYGEAGDWILHPDPDDEEACRAMAAAFGSPVDVQEVGFCWHPDYGRAGDCCEYTFEVAEDSTA